MKPSRALTFAELFAVLAILIVLTTLLTPVLFEVRRNGRLAECKSNLRSLGIAINVYRTDQDGSDSPATYAQFGFPYDIEGLIPDYLSTWLTCRLGINTEGHSHGGSVNSWWNVFPPPGPSVYPDLVEILRKDYLDLNRTLGVRTPIYADFNHQTTYPVTEYTLTTVHYVTLDSSLLTKRARGFNKHLTWFKSE
jgi:type II secretory pathway pseudopilin PulG